MQCNFEDDCSIMKGKRTIGSKPPIFTNSRQKFTKSVSNQTKKSSFECSSLALLCVICFIVFYTAERFSQSDISTKLNVLQHEMQSFIHPPQMKPKPIEKSSTKVNIIIENEEKYIKYKAPYKINTALTTLSQGLSIENTLEIIPSRKTGIRQDLRITLRDKYPMSLSRPSYISSGIPGHPAALIEAENILRRHPIRRLNTTDYSLEDAMVFIQSQPQCYDKPIFLTMATVGDDLYWQLIENFVYTMVKFNISDCALVICVTDPSCMVLCDRSTFPCFDYRHQTLPVS